MSKKEVRLEWSNELRAEVEESVKIKEILEKSKTLTLEKGKSYLMLIDESSYSAEVASDIERDITKRLDVDITVGVVDNLASIRIFELEKS